MNLAHPSIFLLVMGLRCPALFHASFALGDKKMATHPLA
jgi:hypothetical protein